ncbi:hypothetical protein E2C01_069853 [Portunus trituberculatus]|uniref:Uncharacterized protein n=1 Tax=Portunus trituberculatus TaxID=210409 RepID=A0A5B7I019_PORTR|nr:hypothetical protein [Portunus trituberculatus]
MAHTSTAVP